MVWVQGDDGILFTPNAVYANEGPMGVFQLSEPVRLAAAWPRSFRHAERGCSQRKGCYVRAEQG